MRPTAIHRSIAFILIITLTILTVTYAGCDSRTAEISPYPSTDTSSNRIFSALLGETEDLGEEYIDSITFLGDSNTSHLVSFGVLKDGIDTKQVWLPRGNTLALDTETANRTVYCPRSNKYATITEAAALERPEYLVISLGTNGIAYLNENQFIYCYKSLLTAIQRSSPETKIIVQSIYPVTSWYTAFSNDQVEKANEWLLSLAEECGVRYIDTASVLKNENGTLKEEYNSDHKDGYHINKTAAELILRYIRTHGYK